MNAAEKIECGEFLEYIRYSICLEPFSIDWDLETDLQRLNLLKNLLKMKLSLLLILLLIMNYLNSILYENLVGVLQAKSLSVRQVI